MKKIMSLFLAATAVFTFSTGVFADTAPASSSSKVDDVAKMYREKHELKFDLQGKSAKLDGKAISVDKPILKAGRVYVPLRTLKQSGAASSVTWDPQKRQARIAINQEVMPQLNNLSFRIGSEQMYRDNGEVVEDIKIPAPFISGGRAYVPVQALKWLGMSVSSAKDTVSWNWSNKIIQILQPEWETDQASTTFTVLYQKDIYTPQYMTSLGDRGWLGGTGKLIQKDIAMDGRLYNRIQFTVDLRPGVNPLMITANSIGEKLVTVKRTISDPSSVPVNIDKNEGIDYISFTEPVSGYIYAKPGQKIDVAGDILKKDDLFDKLTVQAQLYNSDGNQKFDTVKSFELPIKDQKFSGSFSLNEKGSYLIVVYSPAYLLFLDHGPLMTQWAEFVVEVE